MEASIQRNYEEARRLYAEHGIDVDAALKKLENIKISVHCWQGDDVRGFLNRDQELTGGISVTGSYPEPPAHRMSCAPIWRRCSP